MAARAHTASRPTSHGARWLIALMSCGHKPFLPAGVGEEIRAAETLDQDRIDEFRVGLQELRSAPRKWPPMPWMAVNRTRISPTPKRRSTPAAGRSRAGLLLANAHIEKAGAP